MAKAVLTDKDKIKTVLIDKIKYPKTEIVPVSRTVKINDVLPFRVKFINIGIEAYGSNNAPAIPLQVIGYSNYIL